MPPESTSPTVVSLFSGAGGLDLGLERAGFETLACIERDPDCRATLAANRPGWRLEAGTDSGDIRQVEGPKLLADLGLGRGELGVVAGGPPCQPFSNLGKRQGAEDPLNGDLFTHYLRLVDELLPGAVIFENVEGFRHERHSETRERLVNRLVDLGYEVAWGVLDAADFGDPQHRRRFVLLGSRNGRPELPRPTHGKNVRPHQTVESAFLCLDSWNQDRPDHIRMNISEKVRQRMQRIGPGQNFKALPMEMRPDCWRNGRHQGADTFGRLRLDRPSVTIRTSSYNPSKGRYIHPTEDRGLSTLEMAVLQSFPEEWRFVCAGRPTLVGIGRMIGNAVPIGLATALGHAIRHTVRRPISAAS